MGSPIQASCSIYVKGAKFANVPYDKTRSRLTVLTDTSKVPMLVIKAGIRRGIIVDQMGRARIYHSSILEQSLVESQVDATAFAALTHPWLHCGPRWVGIEPKYNLEKKLACDFFNLLMEMEKLWMKQPRLKNKIHNLIDSHGVFLPDDRDPTHSLSPDLFVQGTSTLFPAPPSTGMAPNWRSCVAVGDAKVNQGRKKMDTFGQLGTYAEQVFSAQENRRFLPTFYFDNSHLVWCTFDRGGAVYGDAVDYHRDPWKLCALVLHFLFDGKDLGMDTSIRYEGGLTLISTTPPPKNGIVTRKCIPNATYVVRRTLLHSTDIRGSGLIYWLVQRHGPFEDPKGGGKDNWCIIKDSWVVKGCEREREIYAKINRSLTQGVSPGSLLQDILPKGQGIAPLLFTQDVFFAGRLDSVSTNRPPGVNTPHEDNRVHTRAVFRTTAGAKLLDHFSSTMELLVAVRDAVQGHRKLHNHGVLHKNITPYRILIQADAQEGDRGVLLDFESPATGSRAFHSRGVAKALEKGLAFTHSYFDDLESFFFVLCYLVACYPATGSLKPERIPPDVSNWFGQFGGWTEKSYMMMDHTFTFPVDDSFQPPVSDLLIGLHSFFHKYTCKAMDLDLDWCPESEEAYDGFIGHLNDAIDGMRVYELAKNCRPRPNMTNSWATTLTDGVNDDEVALPHSRDPTVDDRHRISTSTAGHRSEHPSFTSFVAKGPPKRPMRTPSLGSSKRIKSGDH